MTAARRRLPMGYVLSGIGFLLALALVLVGWQASCTQVHQAQQATAGVTAKLGKVEVAYARLRNQDTAAGIVPASPSLPILLGPVTGEGNGDQGFPDHRSFRIDALGQDLTCTDPSGAGRYVCHQTALTTAPSTTVGVK